MFIRLATDMDSPNLAKNIFLIQRVKLFLKHKYFVEAMMLNLSPRINENECIKHLNVKVPCMQCDQKKIAKCL